MIQKPVKNNLSTRVIIMVMDCNILKTDIESMSIYDKIKFFCGRETLLYKRMSANVC